jgi:hypothetical protein
MLSAEHRKGLVVSEWSSDMAMKPKPPPPSAEASTSAASGRVMSTLVLKRAGLHAIFGDGGLTTTT